MTGVLAGSPCAVTSTVSALGRPIVHGIVPAGSTAQPTTPASDGSEIVADTASAAISQPGAKTCQAKTEPTVPGFVPTVVA